MSIWQKYPDAVKDLTERLRGVIIENDNALDVIKHHDSPETVFYVDPPYLPSTRDVGDDYRFEMTEEDHIKLAEILNAIEGKVILSGYPSDLYSELYRGWEKVEKDSIADGRLPRTECLWLRNIETSIFDFFYGWGGGSFLSGELTEYEKHQKEESEKRSEMLSGANALITALERHAANVRNFADRKQYDYLKDTSEEMLRLLSQLRGAVYMGNP